MKIIKRLLIVIIISLMVIDTLVGCIKIKNYKSTESIKYVNPIKISVFEYRGDDNIITDISNNLKKIEAENPEKVKFTFYDSKNSQTLQNENIDKAIQEGTDLLLLNLVDIESGQQVINKIKENNIPVIVYNREPISIVPIKSYDKAIYIGNDSKEGGILQGQILVDTWKANKNIIDKNGDGIMQYIMLSGGIDNKEALGRSIYSVKTIEDAGIKTEEIALRVANFDKEIARIAIESLFSKYGNKIEVIISNDDTMAIGAIEALQAMGYNTGDEIKTIPVVGFDKEEKARELIEKGFMTGTVIQDPYKIADALYIVGMNLVFRRNALEGTSYVFDETGVSIRIPYEGIFVKTSS